MTDAQAGPLKIGDVARLAELSVDAVRFYEREGLLGRVRRTPAGRGARLLARRGEGAPDPAGLGADAVRAGARARSLEARRHRSAHRRAAGGARRARPAGPQLRR